MNLSDTKLVNKFWGYERWLEQNDHYAYKRIYINAGKRTSLQYHDYKLETNYIISGQARVLIGDTWHEMKEDDFFTIKPKVIHRVEAITDLILMETSTPHLDDVIRLEDDANRPSGKIDYEHQ